MSLPRMLLIVTVVLFTIVGVVGLVKKNRAKNNIEMLLNRFSTEEIDFSEEQLTIAATPIIIKGSALEKVGFQNSYTPSYVDENLPIANRIQALFDPAADTLPIVETVTYSSRVSWLKGRPAWLADYAAHFHTSRHFIARSLNGNQDYFTQNLVNGDRFNVLRADKNINFYLLIDSSRCKMWFYYIDLDTDSRVLLKTYNIGLGRVDGYKASGMLTPMGKYSLGEKIAVYKPGTYGYFNNQKTEMIRIFGTRWIPFKKELEGCTAPAKGLGIHGAPWRIDPDTGVWMEDLTGLSKYESDGCIRLCQNDIEELFSIIITKYTIIELVKDFFDADLPGIEKEI